MLANLIYLLKKPWFLNILTKMAISNNKITNLLNYKFYSEFQKNKEIYEAKERRVLDTITMHKEPDRVPTGGGDNFFSAKYAGITCAEFMFDAKKMKAAYFKMNLDFNLDLAFPSYMLNGGRLLTAANMNILKIPGRDLNVNSTYQWNEFERLKPEEYDDFLEYGIEFLLDTIAPRISNLFTMKCSKRLAYFTRIMLESAKYSYVSIYTLNESKGKGIYNLMGSMALPPFDIISFMFRGINGLARDLLRKITREKIIELCERMERWFTPLFSTMTKIMGVSGIFFPSERAFSLSPKQFETFYWPTLKKMIVSFCKQGYIPFLTWEGDATHLVHFLLELPKKISRRCVFVCDRTDIFQANKILNGHMCIMGNIPLSTLCVGSPKDIEKYCEKLFLELKPGGGFILSPAINIPDEAKPENVKAFIDYAYKYGKYY